MRARPGRLEPPTALTRWNQPVRDHFKLSKTVACEHMANRVVDAIADHLHFDSLRLCCRHKADKARVDRDAVEMRAQLGFAHVEQCHLAFHAFA